MDTFRREAIRKLADWYLDDTRELFRSLHLLRRWLPLEQVYRVRTVAFQASEPLTDAYWENTPGGRPSLARV